MFELAVFLVCFGVDDGSSHACSSVVVSIPSGSEWNSILLRGREGKYDASLKFTSHDQLDFRHGKEVTSCSYVLNTSHSPFSIDCRTSNGKFWCHGIWSIQDDELLMCLSWKERCSPTKFNETENGSHLFRFQLQK
jgi:uncharacterized protein (TIGR03067 family)